MTDGITWNACDKCGHWSWHFEDCSVLNPPKPPTLTVSGNGITVFRLDEQGNPVGEGLSLDGAVEFSTAMPEFNDRLIEEWRPELKTVSIDMNLCDVDPALIALLTGEVPTPEYEVWLKSQPWWRRLLNWWWTR